MSVIVLIGVVAVLVAALSTVFVTLGDIAADLINTLGD